MKNEEKKLRKGRIRIVDKLFTKEDLVNFCNKYGRLPNNAGPTEERRLYQFFKYHRGEPDFEELRNKFKKKSTSNESFISISNFCEKHGRMPYYSERRKEERNLYMIWYNHRNEPEYIKLKEKYDQSVESQVISFCERYGRLPKFSDKDPYEDKLRNFWNRSMKNNPDFLEFNEKYYHPKTKINIKKNMDVEKKIETETYTFEELEEFCIKNNRLPTAKKGESGLYHLLFKHRNESKFKELYEKYTRKYRHTFEELEEFCIKNNRLPSKKKECCLYKFLHKHKDESGFKELYEKYSNIKPSKKIEEKMKDAIIPEPTECNSKEYYVERITKLTKEFLEAWGSEATIDTLETLLKDVNKEKRNALITLYGKLGVS